METTIYICGTEVTLTLLRSWKSDTAVGLEGMRWHYRIKAQFENKEIIYTYHGSIGDFENNRRDIDEYDLVASFYCYLSDVLAYCQHPIEQEFFNCFGYNYYEAKSKREGSIIFKVCQKRYKTLGFSIDRLCKWINDISATYKIQEI